MNPFLGVTKVSARLLQAQEFLRRCDQSAVWIAHSTWIVPIAPKYSAAGQHIPQLGHCPWQETHSWVTWALKSIMLWRPMIQNS